MHDMQSIKIGAEDTIRILKNINLPVEFLPEIASLELAIEGLEAIGEIAQEALDREKSYKESAVCLAA